METNQIKNTPINYSTVEKLIKSSGIEIIGKASIRELVKLVNDIQEATGEKFIRMEMGVPGILPHEIGINAEKDALDKGVAASYPLIDGLPALKQEASRFAKMFMDIDVNPSGCVPTVGSMQGGYATFMMMSRINPKKNTTLFIDPGFPVQKQQHIVMQIPFEQFDVYNYRGSALRDKLESYLSKGNISSILYSNPNNPSWICFTEEELKTIGELANKYEVTVVEDLAYFAMDFRNDLSQPGKAPYQPTVAKYTNNYILLISSSKAFSYAGQRIGLLLISNELFNRNYPDLKQYYGFENFGRSIIYKVLYCLSSGTSHSAQYALAAMLKAANDGNFNFVNHVKEYGKRAEIMKKLFTENGFYIVYDKDGDAPIADGFYFTFAYPNLTGHQLLEKLLFYGISAISLDITGSEKLEGLRACTSQTNMEMMPILEKRLKAFRTNHPL